MKCQATTKAGNPCQANAVAGSRFCVTHLKTNQDAAVAEAELKVEEKAPAEDDVSADLMVPERPAAPASEPTPRVAPNTKPETKTVVQPIKEGTKVDEKKNVGFVPGLALLLAVLALVLISINAVKPTPSVEELEKSMDIKIASVQESIMAVVKNNDLVRRQVTSAMFDRDMGGLRASLTALEQISDPSLTADFKAVYDALDNLTAKITAQKAEQIGVAAGIIAPEAAAPAAAAPAAPAAEEKKDEPKPEEPKKEAEGAL